MYTIRKAEEKDFEGVITLLRYIATLHHNAFPDVFKEDFTKYSVSQLADLQKDDRVIFLVAADGNDCVIGHAISYIKEEKETHATYYSKYLYLDDLCVDSNHSGKGIGKELIRATKEYAKENNCSRIELHAWNFEGSALDFYDKVGFKPKYTTLDLKI